MKYIHITGIGTSNTKRKNGFTVDREGNGEFYGTVEATALILKSPNGTRYKITVDDNGTLGTTKIIE